MVFQVERLSYEGLGTQWLCVTLGIHFRNEVTQ